MELVGVTGILHFVKIVFLVIDLEIDQIHPAGGTVGPRIERAAVDGSGNIIARFDPCHADGMGNGILGTCE